jgi:Tol biopolymer transport system component
VLFISDRSGSNGLWSIRVGEGKAEGSPELLKTDVGRITPISVTNDGAYYYSLSTATQDIYTADLDPETGKLSSERTRVEGRFVGSNSGPAWSPDGEFLLYHSSRAPVGGSETLGQAIVVRSMRTGEERTFFPKSCFSAPGTWYPDGRSLLLKVCDPTRGQLSFHRLDLATGELAFLRQTTPGIAYAHTRLGLAKRLFGWTGDGKGHTAIVAEDLESGEQTELYLGTGSGSISLSPDGRWLAFLECGPQSRALRIMPAAGGKPFRNIEMAPPLLPTSDLAWQPDSRHLVLARSTGQSCRTELWRVALERGNPERISEEMNCIAFPTIAPDGRRIAFGSGLPANRKTEIWVMENFLRPSADEPAN